MAIKTIIIRNATFMWAKTKTPVDSFQTGTPKYELKITTTDANVAKEWSEQGLKVKMKDGDYYCNLRRSSTRKDGTVNPAPKVVDADKNEIKGMIGNGSKGNVKLLTYTSSATNSMAYEFIAVQVIELEPYEIDEIDF